MPSSYFLLFFFLMIRRPPRSTLSSSSAASDVYKRQAIVNAIQQHASIVTQKSLVEGFGLTVSEAMWKARPVVASAVGGLSLIHISEPTRLLSISYAVFCLT